MSLAEAGEEERVAARLAFEADLEESSPPQANGGAATAQQCEDSEDQQHSGDEVSRCSQPPHTRRLLV